MFNKPVYYYKIIKNFWRKKNSNFTLFNIFFGFKMIATLPRKKCTLEKKTIQK